MAPLLVTGAEGTAGEVVAPELLPVLAPAHPNTQQESSSPTRRAILPTLSLRSFGNISAKPRTGNISPYTDEFHPVEGRRDADAEVVARLSVKLVWPLAVIDPGEKAQLAPTGRLAHEKVNVCPLAVSLGSNVRLYEAA